MDAAYIERVISQFISQIIDISKLDKRNLQLGYKIGELEDVLVDFIATEILSRGYFVYSSDAVYEDIDVLEKEWAVTLNQITIDVLGKSIDDGTFPLAQYDKKFEFENKNKDLDLSL